MTTTEPVYVVLEWIDGEPNIESYHRDSQCPEIHAQLTDPDRSDFRAMMQHPGRIADILAGRFFPDRSGPQLVEFACSNEEGRFFDEDGNRHRILPCRECASDDPVPD